MTSVPERIRSDDRGAGYLAAFIVLMSTLVIGGVAALADSGRVSSAQRHSTSIAYESARAGAQELVVSGGTFELDAAAARTRAASTAIELASTSDARLQGVRIDGEEVVVTISMSVDRWFPGLGSVTVTEQGRARLSSGIVEEGQ